MGISLPQDVRLDYSRGLGRVRLDVDPARHETRDEKKESIAWRVCGCGRDSYRCERAGRPMASAVTNARPHPARGEPRARPICRCHRRRRGHPIFDLRDTRPRRSRRDRDGERARRARRGAALRSGRHHRRHPDARNGRHRDHSAPPRRQRRPDRGAECQRSGTRCHREHRVWRRRLHGEAVPTPRSATARRGTASIPVRRLNARALRRAVRPDGGGRRGGDTRKGGLRAQASVSGRTSSSSDSNRPSSAIFAKRKTSWAATDPSRIVAVSTCRSA